jgi:rhamnulokinase
VPASEGAVIRCALESLALRYRAVLRSLEELLGRRIDTIHIVGGGSRNELLCQMTATACQCEVVTGPVEATALGNVIVQAVAAGEIESIAAGRELIRESFETKRFVPADPVPWDEAFERFQGLTA